MLLIINGWPKEIARQTHERRERARLVHWIITRFPFEEDKEISGNRG